MNNRINQLFEKKDRDILSVYFTAGFPALNNTVTIIELLEKNGADLIEVGMPFSDPTADGPTIQHSNEVALKNGMSLEVLFQQLGNIRQRVQLPVILMGYFNPVYKYGVAKFCQRCREIGIDGLILPDLPIGEYNLQYRNQFEENNLHNIFLITPQTSDDRILDIDRQSNGLIYMVSSSSTTGAGKKVEDFHSGYFERVSRLPLKNPRLIGFGISDNATFRNACKYAHGAIIGSAFVKALQQDNSLEVTIESFIKTIRG
jgi:tryptophan synthase alpha chain